MELIHRNLRLKEFAPLVERLAYCMKQKLPDNIDVDDLIQVGMIGLMEAANRYDEMQGVQFSTFAMKRIRGSMLDKLRYDDWAPQGLRRTMRRVDAATTKLQHLLGRSPNEFEIAKELNIPLSKLQKMRFEFQGAQLVHFDAHKEDYDEDFLDRDEFDLKMDPLELLQSKYFHEALAIAISRLSTRERTLMEMRYQQDMNLREIGNAMGFNESRACQIFNRAVKFLRNYLKEYVAGMSNEEACHIYSFVN
ncbi:MAG: RNA polymerase sigma factor FliA [Proteobacteria bacterium]|nr:RNA polymerase sigma factor FliA [Pseudomonadota bacterium]